jgi:MATE family multidrug resistance protein
MQGSRRKRRLMPGTRIADSARRLLPLAWPVFLGQVAVLAFSTVDTMVVARHSAADLAALAVGGAAYVTIFIGLMGVVLAVGPITGQLYGAQRLHEAGQELHQAIWLALMLAVPGSLLLFFPQPFLALANASPELADKVRGYLAGLAFALPASLVFAAFRGFNTAVSRPKIVMLLQVGALVPKVPLTILLVGGAPSIGLPALGVAGCGIATATVMLVQLAAAWLLLQRDPFYDRFALRGTLTPPSRKALAALLKLGIPMGGSVWIEVTGFTFMAFFIARLGATPVAGHQIAVNLVSLMFMVALAIGNATSTLVAQRVGAQDFRDARRLGWHGVLIGVGVAAVLGAAVYALRVPVLRLYTADPVVLGAALPLLAWLVLFHIADAAQIVAAFVLRAWRIATVPLVIYVLALWGVGIGGGYLIAFDVLGLTPPPLRGAVGFWTASTSGLTLAALALVGFLAWMTKHRFRE